jgi:hypothetical protein
MTAALARRFKVDVSLNGTTWVNFKGINDLNPPITPNLQAADTYDTDGWSAFEKTMQAWLLTIKALRQQTAGVFDAGQELVRGQQLGFEDAARIYVRWYDRNGAPEAYMGRAIVGWVPSKTGVADLDEITVTLTGDGVLTSITNPYAATAVPVITSILPAGKGAGQAVTIFGSGFTGTVPATGVKFGGTNATDFSVVNDGQITAVLPAGAAATITVLVTNAAGGSVQTNNYVRVV